MDPPSFLFYKLTALHTFINTFPTSSYSSILIFLLCNIHFTNIKLFLEKSKKIELTQMKKKDKMLQMSFPERRQELRYGC